jgi:hypothetical protein
MSLPEFRPGNGTPHVSTLMRTASTLVIEAHAAGRPITMQDSVDQTVDYFMPMDADEIVAVEMLEARWAGLASLHNGDNIGDTLLKYAGGKIADPYVAMQALVRAMYAHETLYGLQNYFEFAEARAKARPAE